MARSADLGRRVAEEQSATGPGTCTFYPCDVSVGAQVKAAFTAAVGDLGGLDALVHAAGVEGGGKPEDETEAEWDRIFDINAKGTFLTNREAFPHLGERRRAHPQLRIRGQHDRAAEQHASTAASKGAVAAWTRSVAPAWGQYDITVNTICPTVWTPMYEEHRARLTPEQLARTTSG